MSGKATSSIPNKKKAFDIHDSVQVIIQDNCSSVKNSDKKIDLHYNNSVDTKKSKQVLQPHQKFAKLKDQLKFYSNNFTKWIPPVKPDTVNLSGKEIFIKTTANGQDNNELDLNQVPDDKNISNNKTIENNTSIDSVYYTGTAKDDECQSDINEGAYIQVSNMNCNGTKECEEFTSRYEASIKTNEEVNFTEGLEINYINNNNASNSTDHRDLNYTENRNMNYTENRDMHYTERTDMNNIENRDMNYTENDVTVQNEILDYEGINCKSNEYNKVENGNITSKDSESNIIYYDMSKNDLNCNTNEKNDDHQYVNTIQHINSYDCINDSNQNDSSTFSNEAENCNETADQMDCTELLLNRNNKGVNQMKNSFQFLENKFQKYYADSRETSSEISDIKLKQNEVRSEYFDCNSINIKHKYKPKQFKMDMANKKEEQNTEIVYSNLNCPLLDISKNESIKNTKKVNIIEQFKFTSFKNNKMNCLNVPKALNESHKEVKYVNTCKQQSNITDFIKLYSKDNIVKSKHTECISKNKNKNYDSRNNPLDLSKSVLHDYLHSNTDYDKNSKAKENNIKINKDMNNFIEDRTKQQNVKRKQHINEKSEHIETIQKTGYVRTEFPKTGIKYMKHIKEFSQAATSENNNKSSKYKISPVFCSPSGVKYISVENIQILQDNLRTPENVNNLKSHKKDRSAFKLEENFDKKSRQLSTDIPILNQVINETEDNSNISEIESEQSKIKNKKAKRGKTSIFIQSSSSTDDDNYGIYENYYDRPLKQFALRRNNFCDNYAYNLNFDTELPNSVFLHIDESIAIGSKNDKPLNGVETPSNYVGQEVKMPNLNWVHQMKENKQKLQNILQNLKQINMMIQKVQSELRSSNKIPEMSCNPERMELDKNKETVKTTETLQIVNNELPELINRNLCKPVSQMNENTHNNGLQEQFYNGKLESFGIVQRNIQSNHRM